MGNLSYSTITPANISLTPMQVKFNGVDLGGTADHVNLSIKYDLADIMVDQFGKTPLDKRVSGQHYSIKMTITEIKNKNNWKVAFPSAYQVTSGTGLINFVDQIGDSLLSHAQTLLLHPLENATGDYTGDYNFYKAVCMNASEFQYGPEKQVGLKVEFLILPDTSVVPARFMTYGDPSVGIVNAAIAAASAAGGNTGNGTIGTELAYNGFTKTETLTVSAVGTGSSSANIIEVTGSNPSRVLFVGTLAHASASTLNVVTQGGEATFTITQGSTAFALGDSFTIATTAANYS